MRRMKGNDNHKYDISAKPHTPRLTASPNSPHGGDDLTLTCTVSDHSVNKYQFLKDNHQLTIGSSKTYVIKKAPVSDTHNYTCKAYIDTVASDTSNTLKIQGSIY